ncbi:MAG: type I restriction endonuclease subunit R [Verrucomicrobiaceae bacterium]|nr:type I restriction endonuclease subunit R [Verrucomicrobiaceae bacterium]
MPNFISEDHIEQGLVQKLQHLHGFESLNCHTAAPDDLNDGSNRANKRDVILVDRVREAAVRLNPDIPAKAIEDALERLMDRRQAMSLIAANEEVYHLIRDGIPVEFDDAKGRLDQGRVKVIDFTDPTKNDYLAVTQLWIQGTRGFRRPDVLLYVNGLPLVFIELKNSNVSVRNAYDDNLTNYRAEIPQLFHCNAFCVLTNALETRVGSVTAEWEHFFQWLRVDDEKEKINRAEIREKGTSVERVIEGLIKPERLLDYCENFILYYRGTSKIIAQNHQFIGVNRAYERFQRRKELEGKLGVFWHTQGSGKSYSMIFYARKIFRKAGINYTFVIITDRDDLDRQIYKNFLDTGTVSKAEAAQPKDSEQLRAMLGQNKRLVFTLIHKFRWDKGSKYPELSDRDDIIVIVDEAHRTQYKGLAENMRAGLKNANYLAFTGTPLLGRDKKTAQWFGDYVSEYNFVQSVDDGATVPLFYEKRVPEMVNQNQELGDEFYDLLDEANLDDLQQAKLEKKFATELEIIRRPDRLERIAEHIVYHFPRRGYLGKAVVISLDKFTAVRMFDRVERLWKEAIQKLTGQVSKAEGDHKASLKKQLEWMKRVEMAVVVSEEAEEDKKFTAAGLDIARHRQRMNKLDANAHDVEFNFKDPEHPLQLVFVCAMWLTGFDAPTVSTLYLDKPQKDHTLMQTIARANRVTSWKINGVEKKNGEIIDYYGVFRNMKKALKDYAQGPGEDTPVQEKTALLKLLDDAILEGVAYCRLKGILIEGLLESQDVFKKLEDFQRHADTLISQDEWRKGFAIHENTITSLYEACKPEVLGKAVVRKVAVFQYLRGIIDAIIEQQDLDAVSKKIGELLDASLIVDESHAPTVAEGTAKPVFAIIQRGRTWDLSKIDFDKLKAEFKEATYRNIEIADLRAFLEKKMEEMLKVNSTRKDFAQRLQEIINRYNAGGASTENYFNELVKHTKEMKAEDERHVREGLTEDELELFDLLKNQKMTQAEEQAVKLAAKSLLARLKEGTPRVLVQDWFKDSQSQKQVRSTVEEVLNEQLPETYDRAIFVDKCNRVFELMVDYASQGLKWAA